MGGTGRKNFQFEVKMRIPSLQMGSTRFDFEGDKDSDGSFSKNRYRILVGCTLYFRPNRQRRHDKKLPDVTTTNDIVMTQMWIGNVFPT
ncbi:hypothetical protein PVK06_010785 [Gossypium arboreum]|uniref:Uncharacterized protein n=1 Tax=Gossypium arboreum TaxID=29729 RepID=A0ABR0Q7Q7_GOSAR|nr:hypothetical protein PVK06_010785 [Gossypium arboreum]